MDASDDGTVRIRRPWAEELAWLALSVGVGLIAIVAFDNTHLLPLWVLYLVGYLFYTRRMGVDLTPTLALVRRPYRRTKRFRREDVAAVTVERGFVTLRDSANNATKLTVMNSFANWGQARSERTRRQIELWASERPAAAREPARTPGSADL